MSGTLVFPARSSYDNVQHGVNKGTSIFEIYSKSPKTFPSTLNAEKVSINGSSLHHYVMAMNVQELEELMSDSGIYPGNEKHLSRSVFEKIKGRKGVPRIMGIVNVTPDSFYPGSRTGDNFSENVDRMLDQGPDIIDVGGESTRPGSEPITLETELSRIRPVIQYIREVSSVPISVDTRNPATVKGVLDLGIDYINDITGFADPEMIKAASENNLNCIVMHMRGTPKDMQAHTEYSDILFEVNSYFHDRTVAMINGGISPERITVDPGIGFSKDLQGNLSILSNLQSFNLGFGILIGASRKSFIGKITGEEVKDRLPGTIATSIYSMEKGVDILRVHDVRENRSALRVYDSICKN